MDNAPTDSGFTLIELLISTMITAIILTVLTASFLIFFQNSAYTSGRDDHAAGAEALSAWLDRDLASATTDIAPTVTPATACTASPVMLSIFWRQYTAGALPNSFPAATGTLFKSSYAFVPDTLTPSRCMITRTLYSGPNVAGLVQQGSPLTLIRDLVGTAAAPANVVVSTAATTDCQSPDKAVTVTLMQYHTASTSDAAIPYTYFGCVNARTNALPTPSPS